MRLSTCEETPVVSWWGITAAPSERQPTSSRRWRRTSLLTNCRPWSRCCRSRHASLSKERMTRVGAGGRMTGIANTSSVSCLRSAVTGCRRLASRTSSSVFRALGEVVPLARLEDKLHALVVAGFFTTAAFSEQGADVLSRSSLEDPQTPLGGLGRMSEEQAHPHSKERSTAWRLHLLGALRQRQRALQSHRRRAASRLPGSGGPFRATR